MVIGDVAPPVGAGKLAWMTPASALHGFGCVRECVAEHVQRHHFIWHIGRRKERCDVVAIWQRIQQADGVDAVLICCGVVGIRPRIVHIARAAEVMKI